MSKQLTGLQREYFRLASCRHLFCWFERSCTHTIPQQTGRGKLTEFPALGATPPPTPAPILTPKPDTSNEPCTSAQSNSVSKSLTRNSCSHFCSSAMLHNWPKPAKTSTVRIRAIIRAIGPAFLLACPRMARCGTDTGRTSTPEKGGSNA